MSKIEFLRQSIYTLEQKCAQLLKDKEELLAELEKCEQSFRSANWIGTAQIIKETIKKHRP